MEELIKKVEQVLNTSKIESAEDLEKFRLSLLSRKGLINDLFDEFKKVPGPEKKKYGAVLNQLKIQAETTFADKKSALESGSDSQNTSDEDYALNITETGVGSRHPLQIVLEEIQDIFIRAGFVLEDGPEIEDDWHNFSALNFPPNHPARDMQDTFFIDNEYSLRTHTSSVQVRSMENNKPPIRMIAPGRVYRNEAVSARANCFFHQLEALYIDKDVSLADMKQMLLYFAKEFFGDDAKIRLRPSYFPFTEPSAEMDVSCFLCSGKGCNVCKYTGWLEVMGCGMVDPSVLEACGIDSKKFSGYALGMGLERITMLKYDVKDLRTFFDNDIRFLNQFGHLGY